MGFQTQYPPLRVAREQALPPHPRVSPGAPEELARGLRVAEYF